MTDQMPLLQAGMPKFLTVESKCRFALSKTTEQTVNVQRRTARQATQETKGTMSI